MSSFTKFHSALVILSAGTVLFLQLAVFAGQLPVLPEPIPPIAPDDEIKVGVDFYGSQTNLMPYDGYQNDVISTIFGRRNGYKLVPLIRYVVTNYYFLNEFESPNNKIWNSDRRTAIGLGADYKFNDYLKFRFIVEAVKNKNSGTDYTQDSYGVIYNQFIQLKHFEVNNYLESFYIPRVASRSLDTFFKIQALKSHDLSRTATASNVIFPFIQTKVKVNDDSNFGVSGHNFSVGPGYRYYTVNAQKDSFAFVLEIHAVIYQSKDFNGNWMQALAALQLWID